MMDFSNESEEIIESGESETSENENESKEEDNEEVIAEILGNLQPYQYEPGNDNESSDSASESNILPDELSSDDKDDANRRSGNKEWSQCGTCKKEIREIDCLCCQKVAAISDDKFESQKCITLSQQFKTLCLEKLVLKNLLVGLHETRGDLLEKDGKLSNRSLCFAAHKQFIWWIFERSGKNNRRVIPSCVVWTIRKLYPEANGQYVRFNEREID